MNGIESIASLPIWMGFVLFIISMLVIDLYVLDGGREHRVSVKEALGWSITWFVLALIFNGLMWWYLDNQFGRELANQKSLEFFSGYLIEKSLSVDNIFVFLMIFSYFAVPMQLQRRVLFYGVIGAIVMRTIMIFLGAWLIAQFSWIIYLFGAFLVITGIKMLIFADQKPDLANNPLLRWLRKHLKVTDQYHQERFFITEKGVRYATPLFLALVFVEITDLVFAVDSIPAIFAITSDPFIVFSSNMFAIMGLRALYFLLADIADRFHFLKYGLALVLVFVGGKMIGMYWFHLPVHISLMVVASILLISVVVSLFYKKPLGHEQR